MLLGERQGGQGGVRAGKVDDNIELVSHLGQVVGNPDAEVTQASYNFV